MLNIKFHPIIEKPERSCKILIADRYNWHPYPMEFSRKYNAFNVSDDDENDETKIDIAHSTLYIGWIYAEELFWQMVGEAREGGNEIF